MSSIYRQPAIVVVQRLRPWAPGWERLAPRPRAQVSGVVVHRIEVSQEDRSFADSPADIARFFREHPTGAKATGGGMPYPIVIEIDGTVTQTVPLGRVTPHAVSHNPSTIAIALTGDFRRLAPATAQRRVCVAVVARILDELGCDATAVHGHDELSGGSHDPEKECPGHHLSMSELRDEVARAQLPDAARADLPFTWDD